MLLHTQNEIVAVGRDCAAARSVAKEWNATLLHDERDDESLPFRTLVIATVDDLDALLPASDVGAYLVCRRVFKIAEHEPGPIAIFPMVRHPDLTHRQADEHWRDRHAPLALEHHVAMTNYTQLSVLHRFHGPEWDGLALCGFETLEDLRQRFYATGEGKIAIRQDVARFADPSKSPRRVIATAVDVG
jgi:hypothetical protein